MNTATPKRHVSLAFLHAHQNDPKWVKRKVSLPALRAKMAMPEFAHPKASPAVMAIATTQQAKDAGADAQAIEAMLSQMYPESASPQGAQAAVATAEAGAAHVATNGDNLTPFAEVPVATPDGSEGAQQVSAEEVLHYYVTYYAKVKEAMAKGA